MEVQAPGFDWTLLIIVAMGEQTSGGEILVFLSLTLVL